MRYKILRDCTFRMNGYNVYLKQGQYLKLNELDDKKYSDVLKVYKSGGYLLPVYHNKKFINDDYKNFTNALRTLMSNGLIYGGKLEIYYHNGTKSFHCVDRKEFAPVTSCWGVENEAVFRYLTKYYDDLLKVIFGVR